MYWGGLGGQMDAQLGCKQKAAQVLRPLVDLVCKHHRRELRLQQDLHTGEAAELRRNDDPPKGG